MGLSVGSGKRGIMSDVNVVPLIDILLVLLVIFMIIPHRQQGLRAEAPQQSTHPEQADPEGVVVVQIAADGTLQINQSEVRREDFEERLAGILAPRLHRVAFLRGDRSLEFHVVAQVLDSMTAAGADSVGLLTPELEKFR